MIQKFHIQVGRPQKCVPNRRRDEQLHARLWTDLMSVGLSRGSQRQKDYMLYSYIYMKCKNGQNSSTLVEVKDNGFPWWGCKARRQQAGVFCVLLMIFLHQVIWDSSNSPWVYDTCTFLHLCYISIKCFKKYSSPSDDLMEKNFSLGQACLSYRSLDLAHLVLTRGVCQPGRLQQARGKQLELSNIVLFSLCLFLWLLSIYGHTSILLFHLW